MRRILIGLFIGLGLVTAFAGGVTYPPILATTCTNQFIRSLVAATGAGTCATVSLTADVTGTLPAANGGTGLTGNQWTAYTPTATCGTGALTGAASPGGRYQIIGKTVFIWLSLNVSTGTGTCVTSITLSAPPGVTALTNSIVSGEDVGLTALAQTAFISASGTTFLLRTASAGFPVATNALLIYNGVFEQQ